MLQRVGCGKHCEFLDFFPRPGLDFGLDIKTAGDRQRPKEIPGNRKDVNLGNELSRKYIQKTVNKQPHLEAMQADTVRQVCRWYQ